ncbi:MAG: hypothetical protein NVSMB46_00370 [Candidatus Saccharimonadales bacterium]
MMFGHDDNQQNQNDSNGAPIIQSPDPMQNGVLNDIAATPEPPLPMPDLSQSSMPSSLPATHEDLLPSAGNADDLLNIKQEALQSLTPLVGHLEQSPEEKFRTTMMMIQASDDQNLVRTAYEAAKQITDEKTRAQALLDVVNEINYFTQQHSS